MSQPEPHLHALPPRLLTSVPMRLVFAGLSILLAASLASRLFGDPDAPSLAYYGAVFGVMAVGIGVLVWGLAVLPRETRAGAVALEHVPGVGYRAFVAWRYLLNRQQRVTVRSKISFVVVFTLRLLLWIAFGVGIKPDLADPIHYLAYGLHLALLVIAFWGFLRHSRLAFWVYIAGTGLSILCLGLMVYAATGKLPWLKAADDIKQASQVLNIAMLVTAGIAGLAIYFGSLRGVFTFFTTVPVGGVWIGTAALVVVLAVMSGFETDLRDKILGSNAHIQVTKEDGEFVEWREVKAKIDKIPGVVASTPYATSEVVIAANNNGMNVIIKGIDPATVGRVTNLVDDLVDKTAMTRLMPQVSDMPNRTVEKPRELTDVDKPPDDMPIGGDPIDFSGGSTDTPDDAGVPEDAGAPDAVPSDDAPPPRPTPAGDPDNQRATPYGGDAVDMVDQLDAFEPMDSPLIRWATGQDEEDEVSSSVVRVIDVDPNRSRRTLALPGILVGKELVKQTHLYVGDEVRVVSPLSDPSNPDATGTPIPFNRDYRVAGEFFTGMYEYDLKYVYVTLDSLQDFLDLGDTVDGIEVRLESADATDAYIPEGDGLGPNAGLIRQALGPGYRVQDWRELNRSLFSALKLEKVAMFFVLGIVILVASFSIIGNLIMVVVEKAREIALLKTLGASDVGIMQLFAIQGMFIGLIGTILGVATGLLTCAILDVFGLPLDPDVYYINRLPVHVDWESVAAAAVTGVLISIGATLYPALLAARVRPAAGMRH